MSCGGGRVGLRRRFKAPISSEARVRIPSSAFSYARGVEVTLQLPKLPSRVRFPACVYGKLEHETCIFFCCQIFGLLIFTPASQSVELYCRQPCGTRH